MSTRTARITPAPPPADRLLKPEQAADRLQIAPATLREWITAGEFPAHRIGRVWRISEQDLDDWIAASRVPPSAPARNGVSRRVAR